VLVAALLPVAACTRKEAEAPATPAGPEPVTVWFHTGRLAERDVLQSQVADFNGRQDGYRVALTLIPEGGYNAQVRAAALAGDLPDLLDLDGPLLASYAWSGLLVPLGSLLPKATRADLIPSIATQGTWPPERGARLYGAGTFDSGLGLFADRAALAAAGVRVPDATATAWSAKEFRDALAALAERDPDGQVLDLKRNYKGEWFTYAFSPLLVSAGADLIDRKTLKAGGTLDSDAAVAAMSQVQSWFRGGYVDPNLDDAAFVQGRVPLSWAGHWEYGRYHDALGARLAVLPLPDMGTGSRTGQGSWQWAITAKAKSPEGAAAFLAYLLEPEQVLAMANANGAPPGTRAATARSALYGPGGPLRLFAEQLGTAGVPRPRTAAYPAITDAFQRAFADIASGADVKGALTRAAAAIDRDVADNHGYPVTGTP
jgi:multiple sugar transport system substrate-binding protein